MPGLNSHIADMLIIKGLKMYFRKTSVVAIVTIGLISGCGGGTPNQDSTSGSSGSIFIPGVYSTINYCQIGGAQATLVDDSDTLYQVCGTRLSVGKLSGKINGSSTGTGNVQFTIFDSGTPASTATLQLPSGPVSVPVPAGKPTVSTSPTLFGTLLINNGRVDQIMFTDVDGPSYTVSINSKWVGASPVGSIMASYSTLSGNYLSYRPWEWSPASTDDISISANGVISGTTSLGTIAGQITKFNAATGVHKVSVTLTRPVGAPVVMEGVIGPFNVNYVTGSTLDTNYGGLLLAIRGSGVGFYKLLRHV